MSSNDTVYGESIFRNRSLVMGRGLGATKREGMGVKSYPYKKENEKVVSTTRKIIHRFDTISTGMMQKVSGPRFTHFVDPVISDRCPRHLNSPEKRDTNL